MNFVVDGSDFNLWNGNKFASGRGFCQGDFNGDGSVSGSDFGIWNIHKFQSAQIVGVPEPQAISAALVGWLLLFSHECRRVARPGGRRTVRRSGGGLADFRDDAR